MDTDPQTLKSLFTTADNHRLSLERNPNNPTALTAAINAYTTSLTHISQLHLFSPNEALDDLATSSLPYLLAHYHLAELLPKTTPANNTPHSRLRLLAQSRAHYERFLFAADSYGLVSGAYAKLLERYTEGPTTFSTTTTGGDGAARRNAKIANFKAEQALKQKLAYLRANPGYGADDEDEAVGGGGGGGGGDDEIVRSTHLAHIALSIHLAFQALDSLNREADLLALAPEPLLPWGSSSSTITNEQDERQRQQDNISSYSERLDRPLKQQLQNANGPILSKEGKPLQPFTIVGTRQERARGVFRPGHNLPTMSIDEYLAEEKRRGGIIEGGGEASWARPEVDEDDEEVADAATMKARAWDEFTEANPRGSGNTLNRG